MVGRIPDDLDGRSRPPDRSRSPDRRPPAPPTGVAPAALRRADLDAMECPHPDCGADHDVVPVAFPPPACHPQIQATVAAYDRASGCVLLLCPACHAHVARVEVAR